MRERARPNELITSERLSKFGSLAILAAIRNNRRLVHEETDDPLYADRRNFYKVEEWRRDGRGWVEVLFAGVKRTSSHLRRD